MKLTLSQPSRAEAELRNVYGRVVELREGPRLSLVFHHARHDVTKNFTFEDGLAQVGALLGAEFRRARLFTTSGDWEIDAHGTLRARRPAFTVSPEMTHDRAKTRALAGGAPFLRALGVTNASGVPRPGMADKLRQIQRFTELLGHLVDDSPLRGRRELRVVDMGAGKGYLTFATSAFFAQRGVAAEVTGVEQRAELAELTEGVARACGVERLRFVRGSIGEFAMSAPLDVLIALHACDTATDDAIFQGIRAGAALIVTAPCCHQELRAALTPPEVLRVVLKHGILLDREAETLTDAIRALLLEIHGYEARVFEFISTEHTAKNVMIAAVQRAHPIDAAPLRERLRGLLDFYGIRRQRLAGLLGEQ